MSTGRSQGVIEVSDKNSEKPTSSRKPGHGTNGGLCSYALKGVEKDSDDDLEEGEIEEGELEAPSHDAVQAARKGVIDLSLGNADNETVGRAPTPVQASPSGAVKAVAENEPWFGKSKLEHLVRLAEPVDDATALEEPATKKVKAQASDDSKPSPTRAGNGKAQPSNGGEDENDDMEIDSEGTGAQARRASTSSLPPAPKEVKSAAQMSSFAKRLLEKRTGPAPVEPPPEIIPMDDYILEGFKEEYVQRAPTEGSDSDSDVEVAEGLKPIGLLGGRPRSSDDVKDGDGERAGEGGGDEQADPAANRIVRMTNIPFTTTEKTLRELFERFGEVEEVQMIIDRETNRFRGICVATYKVLKCATSAVRTLHERLLEGRKVFVDYQTDRRRSFNNRPDNRYFLIDANIKCRRCGGEGHTLKLCPEAQKIKPCHICGALNAHDPNMCPDRVDMLEEFNICLYCGGTDHPTSSCPNVANGVDKLETGCVRCIRCAQYGHVNCGADDKVWRPGSRSADYCYKCGGNTHMAQRCSQSFAEHDDGTLRRSTTGGGTHIRYNDNEPPIEQDRYRPDNDYNQSHNYPRQQEYQHQQHGGPPASYPPPPTAPAHVLGQMFDPPYAHGGDYAGGPQYYPPPQLPGGPPPPAYPALPPVSNAYPPYSPTQQYPGPGQHFGNGGPPPPPVPQQHYPPQPQVYNTGPGWPQHDYHDGGYRRHSSGF